VGANEGKQQKFSLPVQGRKSRGKKEEERIAGHHVAGERRAWESVISEWAGGQRGGEANEKKKGGQSDCKEKVESEKKSTVEREGGNGRGKKNWDWENLS